MMSQENRQCPCCSGLEYKQCCQKYHEGAFPENALKLMRSRYSAYACHLPKYLIKTTHEVNPNYKSDHETWEADILKFCLKTEFEKLEILSFQDDPKEAFVTFVAYLSQQGKDTTFTEKSRFLKVGPQWLYCEGKIAKGRQESGLS